MTLRVEARRRRAPEDRARKNATRVRGCGLWAVAVRGGAREGETELFIFRGINIPVCYLNL
jgi:hypothetical protein